MRQKTKHRVRQVRRLLWDQSRQCRRCGVVTILPEDLPEEIRQKNPPANMATLQHMFSRLNPARRVPAFGDRGRYSLYCHKCNMEDGREELAALPKEIKHALGKGKKPHEVIPQVKARQMPTSARQLPTELVLGAKEQTMDIPALSQPSAQWRKKFMVAE